MTEAPRGDFPGDLHAVRRGLTAGLTAMGGQLISGVLLILPHLWMRAHRRVVVCVAVTGA
jgi:hypothetical protein